MRRSPWTNIGLVVGIQCGFMAIHGALQNDPWEVSICGGACGFGIAAWLTRKEPRNAEL